MSNNHWGAKLQKKKMTFWNKNNLKKKQTRKKFAHMIKNDVPDVIHYQPLYETLHYIHHILYTSKHLAIDLCC